MKKSLHHKAIQLRRNGWSYNIIAQRLKISKSTLSQWLREVPYSPNREVRKRVREGPAKSGAISHKKRLASINSIKKSAAREMGSLTKRDLWMIGVGLYIGEGTKLFETVQMVNSDPHVVRLTIKWFRDVCNVPIEHFSIALHIYPDTSEEKARLYWSQVSGIPSEQFKKTQVDRRTNKSYKRLGKLPYGTAHIRIKACEKKEFGVVLHRRIMGWIESVYKKMRV